MSALYWRPHPMIAQPAVDGWTQTLVSCERRTELPDATRLTGTTLIGARML